MMNCTRGVERDGYENVTASQVKKITVLHQLPRRGYELRATLRGYSGWVRRGQYPNLGEKSFVFRREP